MVEMANVFAVGLAAKQAKLSTAHPDVAARQNFDVATREKLEALAPAAIPYVGRWLGDHALIGACVFGLSCAWTIAGNMSAVRALAPPPKKDDAKPEPLNGHETSRVTPPLAGMEGPPPSFRQ